MMSAVALACVISKLFYAVLVLIGIASVVLILKDDE